MKKVLIVITILMSVIACNKSKEQETENQSNVNKDNTREGVRLRLPDKLITYLTKENSELYIISKEEWLESMGGLRGEMEMQTNYEKDVFIKSDFNGDQREDYAGFFSDGKIFYLMVFHQTENDFEKFEVQKYEPVKGDDGISRRVIGATLALSKAGMKKVVVDESVVGKNFKQNGFYEQAFHRCANVYYFNGKTYDGYMDGDCED